MHSSKFVSVEQSINETSSDGSSIEIPQYANFCISKIFRKTVEKDGAIHDVTFESGTLFRIYNFFTH